MGNNAKDSIKSISENIGNNDVTIFAKEKEIHDTISEQINETLNPKGKDRKITRATQEKLKENFEQTKENQIFEHIQQRSNAERLREIGINVRAQDVHDVNRFKISDKMIEILEFLIEQGIKIDALDVKELKETTLTKEQIKENIKTINEGGFDIESEDIGIITKEIFTINDINKAKTLRELGIKINETSIIKIIKIYDETDIKILEKITKTGIETDFTTNSVKEITEDDIEKIKKISEIGVSIKIDSQTLNRIRTGNTEKITELKKIGINISDALYKFKNFIESDINTIIKLKKLGIQITEIKKLGNIAGLTDNDIENIETLIGLGIKIDENNIQKAKGLTEIDINNIKNIQEFKKDILIDDISYIKGMKLFSNKDIENIKKLISLGIKFDIKYIKDMKGITNTNIKDIKELIKLGKKFKVKQIKYIKDMKGITNKEKIKELKNIGKKFKAEQIKYLKLITKENIEAIAKLQENFGITFKGNDIIFMIGIKISETDIENIKKLTSIGYKVTPDTIFEIYNINENDIENMKELLKSGIKINNDEIKNFMGLSKNDIEKIKTLLEIGIKINGNETIKIRNVDISQNDIKKLKILHEIGINSEYVNIPTIKKLELTEKNIENIKQINQKCKIKNLYEIQGILENKEIIEMDNKNIYKGYNYHENEIELHQKYTKGKIIEEIEQYIQEKIEEKKEIGESDIINKIKSKILILSQKEKINLIGTIYELVNKHNTIKKYLDFEKGPYKSPKELLCAIRGIKNKKIIKEINDNITVKQHGVGLNFFIPDEKSYQIIFDCKIKSTKKNEESGGFNNPYSYVTELLRTLSVSNGKDPGNDKESYGFKTIWHEGQHNRNSYFMPDKGSSTIARAKDEISAYLRDGRNIETIKEYLTTSKRDGGIYTYNLKRLDRIIHKQEVKKLIKYTKDIISTINKSKSTLNKDEIISTLSSVPREGWKELRDNMLEIIKEYEKNDIKKSKITETKEKFIKQIKDWSENRKLVEYLINRRNLIFPKDEIKMENFWRTGTEKLKTVINKIENCNSLEEIKYTLNDPKYSNISRGPNNKGGIEISAIIDEVKAGKLSEEFIPVEIREKVMCYIK